MAPPILFLVSDQGSVLEALSGDLARRLGVEFRILSERTPTAALATLDRLANQSEEIALIIAAQRMGEMPGLDVLVQAHELHPTAKRILLIGRRDWSATNPVVQAMALGQIDSYLFEPWLPHHVCHIHTSPGGLPSGRCRCCGSECGVADLFVRCRPVGDAVATLVGG
jgi:thioredoxin reductase (NADPH)